MHNYIRNLHAIVKLMAVILADYIFSSRYYLVSLYHKRCERNHRDDVKTPQFVTINSLC